MKKWITLVILFTTACNAPKPQAQGTLVIIGGGSRPSLIIERIIQEARLKDGGYGVVLPMSSSSDSSVYFAVKPFQEAGIQSLRGMNFKKGEPQSAERLDSVRNARLIYITGGDQERFMGVVRGTPLEQTIREAFARGAVIAGTSAGAAVMSEKMTTGNQLRDTTYTSTFKVIESNNLEIKPGLGLITGVLIDQHFLIRSRHNRLLTGVIDYPDHVGIGIDESTAIVVKGRNAEVIGDSQVLVIRNPGQARREAGRKLGANGLTINILLPGDEFTL
ncbi:MAG: cyanophycinase [Cyclobacteriaceae bacterium]|nr:cyanophycinase [Cyclobacteriaceae bacterium]